MSREFPGAHWWRFDFHNHTPASFDVPDKSVTPKDWLRAYIKAQIRCVAITDHNTGSWIDKLQHARAELIAANEINVEQLVLFPGVEVSVANGVHVLALFDPQTTGSKVSQLLGAVEYKGTEGDSDGVTRDSLEQVVITIAESGGIAIPAHVDQPKGLFRSVKDALTLEQLAKECGHRLLAIQVTDPNADILKSVRKEWRDIAWIRGSDSHDVGAAGKDTTWVKMGVPNLDGLKLALLDFRGSIQPFGDNADPNRTPKSWIRSIAIADVKHRRTRKQDGQDVPNPLHVEFNPWFNAVIGGRGSGKSSLVEFIRLALRQDAELQSVNEGPLKLVADTFRKFAVVTDAQDSGALLPAACFHAVVQIEQTSTRVCWQHSGGLKEVCEQTEAGDTFVPEAISDAYVRARFPVTVLSQKQIFALAEQRDFLLKQIDRTPEVDRATWQRGYDETRERFFALQAQVRQMTPELANRSNLEAELREVKRKLKALELSHHSEVLKRYQKYRAQIGEQKVLLTHWRNQLQQLKVVADKTDQFTAITTKEFDASVQDERQVLEQIESVEANLRTAFVQLRNAVAAIDSEIQKFETVLAALPLTGRHRSAEQEYKDLLTALKAQGVDSPERYAELVSKKQTLEQELGQLEKRKKEQEKLENDAAAVLVDLKEQRRQLTQRRQTFITGVVKQATTAVKLELIPYGNARAAEAEFRELIKQPTAKQAPFAPDILETIENGTGLLTRGILPRLFAPVAGSIETELDALKNEIIAIRREPGKYTDLLGQPIHGKLRQHLETKLTDRDIDAFRTWFPEDGLELAVELDGGKYRNVDLASAGQKSAAVLALLLAFGEEPLVVDQPEDDLDNAMVMQLVVEQIRRTKSRRQLIIVTHNPNVVVNGDAEFVLPMKFHKGQIEIEQGEAGAVADKPTRKEICRIMEGGERAFKLRYKKILEHLN